MSFSRSCMACAARRISRRSVPGLSCASRLSSWIRISARPTRNKILGPSLRRASHTLAVVCKAPVLRARPQMQHTHRSSSAKLMSVPQRRLAGRNSRVCLDAHLSWERGAEKAQEPISGNDGHVTAKRLEVLEQFGLLFGQQLLQGALMCQQPHEGQGQQEALTCRASPPGNASQHVCQPGWLHTCRGTECLQHSEFAWPPAIAWTNA